MTTHISNIREPLLALFVSSEVSQWMEKREDEATSWVCALAFLCDCVNLYCP